MKYKKIVLTLILFVAMTPIEARFYSSGSPKENKFALTYDDGPAAITEKLIDLLEKNNVKATFFILGENINKYPDTLKRAHNLGHELGCHTYSHKNFYILDKKPGKKDILKKELDLFEKRYSALNLPKVKLLRMPNGFSKKWAIDIVSKRGYVMVNWTFGCDWQKMSEEEMRKAYLKALSPGQ